VAEAAVGPDHPDVALTLNGLAELHRAQGDYPTAEPYFARALAIREEALGDDHPDVALTLASMAALYRVTGREEEAGRLEERAAAIRSIKR
jgi:tetratricopeptide (TPR) repeat protein